ncbi:hypothetical protein NKR23_g6901 [Pleurostoma richardsiae]|uniref:Uncharacterized protein n=1 Tax=Pleurostoma richardsiae TaxID=41990 RepID=A0AA38VRY9_9PEZI|nr:hypothetical protein NKR23_g6901 [Pleurostoma richardsiae]
MLRFLYSADYRDCSSEGSVDAIAFNLEMLAQAGKYGIDALGQLAMEKLSAAAEEHWDTPSFVDVVSLAYRRVDILDDTVREVLVRVATDHAPELLSKSAFVGLMGNVQRFRNDFLEAALRREQETKRELPCMYCDLAERDCMCAAIWSG